MNLITTDELRRKLERGDDFRLVMTLSRFAFEAKRIPTSLHFDDAVSRLHRGDEIVVYCGGYPPLEQGPKRATSQTPRHAAGVGRT
jgi:hypothetical protein